MIKKAGIGSIAKQFGKVNDPRIERTKRHKMLDILLIAICAVICRADSWVDIEMFGKSKLEWLRTFLLFPMGFLTRHLWSGICHPQPRRI
jgi:hypothetical protein